MIRTCHACGVEKDEDRHETYPHPFDYIDRTGPIPPFFDLECQGRDRNRWKSVRVCHNCFHKIRPDMWINQDDWESLGPVTPFDDLPEVSFDD